ncbi:MAG TPA: N-6 DNA methylase [Phycisphaerales bacterium]|nr:N-6 DNA methylase [Phycisphaerales bacterium]
MARQSKAPPRSEQAPATPRPGYIIDFISREEVRETPEERDAVQVFARRLVEDYGYVREQIQTRPQFRVRARPSDEDRSFPVDIAVFRSPRKTEDELFMVVECKKKERRDGEHQLRLYLDMSAAEVGVWFNGENHLYLRKIHHRDGRRTYEELPTIPRKGQRIEDIGLYKRKDLRKPANLKATFRDIRNHLAGMTTGITRDEALAQEIINILFCKILDEQECDPGDTVVFRAGVGESADDVKVRIVRLFDAVKNKMYGDVFEPSDTIRLDAESLRYVVGELQNYCIMDADRDAVGDAFEVFIGPALRGSEGQFFTPRNVVDMMVRIVDPRPGEKIIDPACGSGGFLIGALAHVWAAQAEEAKRKGWKPSQLARRQIQVSTDCFRGIDKDAFLAKVCKAYMALVGDGRGGVFCRNSLEPYSSWPETMREKIKPGTFDVILTNPPFGKKIVVKGEPILSQFDLGYKWKRDKGTKTLVKTATLHDDQPPQILFLERCLQLLKPGGRLGIVLPEAVFGMPTYEYVVTWLQRRAKIRGVVSMPEPLFKTSGKGGTHAKVCVLFVENTKPTENEDYDIFMADVKWCGHDSRANPTYRKDKDGKLVLLDDIPLVQARHADLVAKKRGLTRDRFGFLMTMSDVRGDIFIPKYYDPELERDIVQLRDTHKFVQLADLCKGGKDAVLSWETGIEVGRMAYGTGDIPFIRTSDISNWELKGDPKQAVSEDIYEANRQDVKAGDIFVVRDGTYLVGTSCILTEKDTRILTAAAFTNFGSSGPRKWIRTCFSPFSTPPSSDARCARSSSRATSSTRLVSGSLKCCFPFPRIAPYGRRSRLRRAK